MLHETKAKWLTNLANKAVNDVKLSTWYMFYFHLSRNK